MFAKRIHCKNICWRRKREKDKTRHSLLLNTSLWNFHMAVYRFYGRSSVFFSLYVHRQAYLRQTRNSYPYKETIVNNAEKIPGIPKFWLGQVAEKYHLPLRPYRSESPHIANAMTHQYRSFGRLGRVRETLQARTPIVARYTELNGDRKEGNAQSLTHRRVYLSPYVRIFSFFSPLLPRHATFVFRHPSGEADFVNVKNTERSRRPAHRRFGRLARLLPPTPSDASAFLAPRVSSASQLVRRSAR